MSGDSKEQPNIFYTKVPQNEAHDSLLLQGKVKSVYEIADDAGKVYMDTIAKAQKSNYEFSRRIAQRLIAKWQ